MHNPNDIAELITAKHTAITALLDDANIQQACDAINLLHDTELSFVPQVAAEIPRVIIRNNYRYNNLARLLFDDPILKDRHLAIKRILEHGGDIALASHVMIMEDIAQHIEGQVQMPHGIFNQNIKQLFPTTSQEARAAIQMFGVEKNYFYPNLLCHLSHCPPRMPILLRGKLYDLPVLVAHMQATPDRRTSYMFSINGIEFDTQEIQYWPKYFANIEHLLNNPQPYTNAIAQACTFLEDNIFDLKFCLIFILSFFVGLACFVALAYMAALPFILTFGLLSKESLTRIALFEYCNLRVLLYAFSVYSAGFAMYVANLAFIPNIAVTAYCTEPITPIYRSIFQADDTEMQRDQQRKPLLLSFNRLISESRAPAALTGGADKHKPDLVEKILDFNFGVGIRRFE